MIDEADRLQRRFFAPVVSADNRMVWEPPVDIFEDDRTVRIIVALPGVDPRSIDVRTEPDALFVTGRRRLPGTLSVRRMEIPHGVFGRRIGLPLGRFLVTGSRFENGCLEVDLLKLFRPQGNS